MNFAKRNTTIIVLMAVVISALAFQMFAVSEIIDWPDLARVSIRSKQVRGDAPQTESAYLSTYSDHLIHKSYAEIGCTICGGWKTEYSDVEHLDPDPVSVSKYFPSSCWNKDNHGTAGFDIEIYEDLNN